MSERTVSAELLNAYVDGELEPAAAAEVARAIAQEPMLAREVAALSRLRVAVAESVEAPPPALPSPKGWRWRIAIAASVVLAACIVGFVVVSNPEPRTSPDWLAVAWAVHDRWPIDATADPGATPVLDARPFEPVADAYVPDLSASRLSLIHTAVVSMSEARPMLVARYRGTRGCTITLLAFPSPKAWQETLSPFRHGHREAYGWRFGSLGYLILSDGMDAGRFRLLAQSVRSASRQHLPFDAETRTALRESRDQSAPCLA